MSEQEFYSNGKLKRKSNEYDINKIDNEMNYKLFGQFKKEISVYLKIMATLGESSDSEFDSIKFAMPEKNTDEILKEYQQLIVDDFVSRDYQARRVNGKVYEILFQDMEEQIEGAQHGMFKQY